VVIDWLFLSDPSSLLRIIVVGTLAYIVLVAELRISGKRTLSKLNAFDFVVTVALGSTLATILLVQEISLVEGALALALLIGLQLAVSWTSARVPIVDTLVKSEPKLVLYEGSVLDEPLLSERLTRSELLAAARQAGHGEIEEVHAIVLETDGSLSVIARGSGRPKGVR
jgi:uncharacterized membrane protein YcaP (DUF421 family)